MLQRHFYSPLAKFGKGNIFTGVCLFTEEGNPPDMGPVHPQLLTPVGHHWRPDLQRRRPSTLW